MTYLNQAGLVTRPTRGHITITDEGRAALRAYPEVKSGGAGFRHTRPFLSVPSLCSSQIRSEGSCDERVRDSDLFVVWPAGARQAILPSAC